MMLHSKTTYIASALLLLLMVLTTCDSSTSPEDQVNFDRSEMLANYANNIFLPSYEDLQTKVKDLQTAAQNFDTDKTLDNLQTLQAALKDARLAWQDVSPFQFGPSESVLLRSSLNTYPVDTDQVNEFITSGSYTFGTINSRDAAGLPALGYLLHGVGDTNEDILAMYSSDTEAEKRMTFLLDNISFIKDLVDTVTNEWQSSGGDHIGTFLSEDNAGTDVGSSLGMLINSYVLHYERFLRDGKIGIPAGVRSASIPRPAVTEAYFAGYSLELAIANLTQIEQVFTGGNGVGLDDNLEALGAGDLSDEIQTQIDEAQDSLGQLSDPLSQEIEDGNNDPVLTSFQELQDVVVLLKADMTSILGITITFQDNDGD